MRAWCVDFQLNREVPETARAPQIGWGRYSKLRSTKDRTFDPGHFVIGLAERVNPLHQQIEHSSCERRQVANPISHDFQVDPKTRDNPIPVRRS